MMTLHIRQEATGKTKHKIRLTLKRKGVADIEAEATISFALTPQEQEELRWYMEDYLQVAETVEDVQVEQIEAGMKRRGEELYKQVLAASMDTQAIWFAVREQLADLRIEITTGIAEAAAIPWELMRDPLSDSAIALRVQSFVRVQSNPNISFVSVSPATEGANPAALRCLPPRRPQRRRTPRRRQPPPARPRRGSRPFRHHRPAPAHFRAASEGTHRCQASRSPLPHRPLRRARLLRGLEQDHFGRLVERHQRPDARRKAKWQTWLPPL